VAPADGPVGTAISDRPTVSGGTSPTGTVTLQPLPAVHQSAQCGQRLLRLFRSATAGTCRRVAIYNRDVNNSTVSTGCHDEPVTIR